MRVLFSWLIPKSAKCSWCRNSPQISHQYLGQTKLVHQHLALLRPFLIYNILPIISQCRFFYFSARPWYSDESVLRYYATFKVRKFESLFYKINTCLQKTITCIGLQTEQIFSVNIWYRYFFNFGRGFCGSFPMLFPKAPASCCKKILN